MPPSRPGVVGSSSSNSSGAGSGRSSKPSSDDRWSELALARRKLKLLSAFPRALSPTLPPSPPASRSVSPELPRVTASRSSASVRPTDHGADKTSIPSPPSDAESGESRNESRTSSRGARTDGAASDWASPDSRHGGADKTVESRPGLAGDEDTASSSSSHPRDRKRRRVESSGAGRVTDTQRTVVPVRQWQGRGSAESDADVASRQVALAARAATVWDADKFRALAHTYRERARKLKHTADARSRAASSSLAQQHPPSSLVFLTELTDSILLWVYAFWADDQTTPGRVNVDMWRSLDGMKKVVRAGWETVVKTAEETATSPSGRARLRRVRAVLGLVYLVDALVLLHTTTYAQSSLHNRTQRLQATLPRSTQVNAGRPTNGTAGGSSSLPADSPASLASSSVSSPAASGSDPSSAPTLAALPADYLPAVLGLTASLTRALRLHGTAQALLAERDLARDFPRTWSRCHPTILPASSSANRPRSVSSDDDGAGSDSSDDEADDVSRFDPSPAAVLAFSPASPQLVDPDTPSLGWAWPIGLASVPALAGIPGIPQLPGPLAGGPGQAQGMGGMLPHLVGFGRSLLAEWAEGRARKDSDLKDWVYDLGRGWIAPPPTTSS